MTDGNRNRRKDQSRSAMTRREALRLLGYGGLAAFALPHLTGCEMDTVAGGRPNIILIFADDVGISNVGCYGGPYPTPNIDALASKGVRFEYCYSAPICGPSRAEVLTGRYPYRTGVMTNNGGSINPANEKMISTVLKSAGYVTCSVGKWQLPYGPLEWDFDEGLTFPGHGRYWGGEESSWGRRYTQNGVEMQLPEGGYFPDVMHDFACDFISRNKDKPFFLYYPMSHMHSTLTKTPDSQAGITTGSVYGDNMAYMDKLVGKLVDEVDSQGLGDNTLIIFTGDNGHQMGGTVNGRRVFGEKRKFTEGGTRVPFIARWQGVTPAGKVNRGMTDFSDFLPTFAELAGAGLPGGVVIDGYSVAPQLHGSSGSARQYAFVGSEGGAFVTDGKFKLNNRGQLFDMSDAPWNEIPTNNPEALARLQAALDKHSVSRGSRK